MKRISLLLRRRGGKSIAFSFAYKLNKTVGRGLTLLKKD